MVVVVAAPETLLCNYNAESASCRRENETGLLTMNEYVFCYGMWLMVDPARLLQTDIMVEGARVRVDMYLRIKDGRAPALCFV